MHFTLREAVPDAIKAELVAYDEWLQQLLYNRGIADRAAAELFLQPSYDDQPHDPYLLNDMAAAVSRLSEAITRNERVVIYSDYDCDGIPGAVVLHDFFTTIGYQNFHVHIPHRHYDGFGLSVAAVEKLHKSQSPALLITIDCGTTDLEAVDRANELGINTIITDHHEPKETLPNALAIINPKIGTSYPFTGLCGAAVVFKLVQAMIRSGHYQIPIGHEKWWLDMVGLATIADMVPLRDENRVFAHYGLTVLRKSRRPGLQQLLRRQKASQSHLTEDDIGFTIGPRINAASRMDDPEDAFRLLATRDETEASARVEHLERLNQERKNAVAQMTKELHERLSSMIDTVAPIIVMGNPEWRPSLVGLAANKLAEEYSRPVFLWGRDGNGSYKGSCRSGGGISVVKLMNEASTLFVEYGGHHASGGFTVRPDRIHDFPIILAEVAERLGDAAKVTEPIVVDMELMLEQVTPALVSAQRQCGPFGCENPKPVYLLRRVSPTDVTRFGKGREHTKLIFSTTGLATEAIAFFRSPEEFTHVPKPREPLSLLVHLEESYFMRQRQTRFRIIDILP